jgi:primosomal protein N' (replication factor Y)
MGDFYADVILPLPLKEIYTYRVPDGMDPRLLLFKRVKVGFGRKKHYSALVTAVHSEKPSGYSVKPIESVLDERPVINSINLELWRWISHYYICPMGDVMNAAFPAGLKPESESIISMADSVQTSHLLPEEIMMAEFVRGKRMTAGELEKKMGSDFSTRVLKRLIEKEIVLTGEVLPAGYRPKLKTMVSIGSEYDNKERWEALLGRKTKSKSEKVFLKEIAGKMALFTHPVRKQVEKRELRKLKGYSDKLFGQLVGEGILVTTSIEESRLETPFAVQAEMNLLNEMQIRAIGRIRELMGGNRPILLHGVTGSGKTEIYIHLIEETCRKGMQILYLVPEISMTPQIVHRLQRVFGNSVGIYHSRMGDSARVEVWNRVMSFGEGHPDTFRLILGTRSALFLPFSNLGLIIVDEEHDNSYKQSDPSPRYHARDMAVVMGAQHHCPVLLGTATPSFESYQNVKNGKYDLVSLFERYGDASMPEMVVANVRDAWKRKRMISMLTPELYEGIQKALQAGEQVILFQNRRGYSSYIECLDCGWIPCCLMCDVSLTYHRKESRMVCHYCGRSSEIPPVCLKCGSANLRTRGFGTEKVEDEISRIFPEASISRMDQDSTRRARSLNNMISQLESRKTDILIGTQMVTKGLDFGNVSVIGILNADNLLNFPDFRAHERAYQLMMQVSGRSGRKEKKGTVYIQTSQPDHPVIQYLVKNDFEGFFNASIGERSLFQYPPVYRLIKIILKMKNEHILADISLRLAEYLKAYSHFRVLGPQAPLVGRVLQWHIREIWLKTGKKQPLSDIGNSIVTSIDKIRQSDDARGLVIHVDVDPV